MEGRLTFWPTSVTYYTRLRFQLASVSGEMSLLDAALMFDGATDCGSAEGHLPWPHTPLMQQAICPWHWEFDHKPHR